MALVVAALAASREAGAQSSHGTMTVRAVVRDACDVFLGSHAANAASREADDGESSVRATCTYGTQGAATVSKTGSLSATPGGLRGGMRIEIAEGTMASLFPANFANVAGTSAGVRVRIVTVVF